MVKTRKNRNKTSKKHRTFKKDDFVSGDGMMVSVWGSALWHSLHTMSFNYPVNPTEDDKKNYDNPILH